MNKKVRTTDSYMENYIDKLKSLRKFIREATTTVSQNCIDLFESSISEIISLQPELKEELIRTLSKDFSRYVDPWIKYQRALSKLDSKDSDVKELRRKIVLSPIFFKEIWREDSTEFFRTRKYLKENLKDDSLRVRINQTLDCIITSLKRSLIDKYGN